MATKVYIPELGRHLITHHHICEGIRMDGDKCTMEGTEERVWAGVKLRWCKKHAKEWDNVVTCALTGEWSDDNALQEQSAAA